MDPKTPVALVVGGSRGLGLLIAGELGRRGLHPVIWARDAEELRRAAARLLADGIANDTAVCDVRDHARVAALVEEIERDRGPIEVAIHVAGVIQVGPLAAMTRDHFTEAIDIMQWGPITMALAVLPAMRRRGRGRIGTVASIGGLVSVPHLLPYSTAKFGAVGFTQGLRAELAGTGITATTVAPGLMRTGSHLQAEMTGDAAAEYAWFAPGASLPLLSMDAERAARRIVRGVLRGRSTVILTPLAKVGARVAGVAPATTAVAMGLLARVLPAAPSAPSAPTPTVRGETARRQLGSGLVERLTTWGNRAADRFNET
ncbi:MAG: SDR family oxidoreductase [Actinomycetota bacterium]|nr:SDR family oxidoreductase [Actinomycetota bacterium]